ncbi:MAG: PilZ domain [Acidimicrobiaceae bacterium]
MGERRAFPRLPLPVPVGFERVGDDTLVAGTTRDISLGGLRATTPMVLPEGAHATVVLELSSGPPIVAVVEVLSQTILIEDVSIETRCRFVSISAEDRMRLAAELRGVQGESGRRSR